MDINTIYLICLGVGLLFAVASAFFADFGGGHEAHVDTDTGHLEAGPGTHHMPGFSPLSPTAIATFVTAFGGFGLILSNIGITRSPWLNAPLAALGGLIVAALVVVVFNKIFHSTQGSSEGRVAELFGTSAIVITPIAAGGVGEIAYVQGGTRYTASARALDERAIPSGAKVRIVRTAGSQFYVTHDYLETP
jgi:membrane protein implicated in regulation of membrane protease activity